MSFKCKALTISRKMNLTRLDLLFVNTKLAEKEEVEKQPQADLDKTHV